MTAHTDVLDISSLQSPSDRSQSMLVYGQPGSGKTTSLLTLPPSACPVLLLDFDGKSSMLHGAFEPGQLYLAPYTLFPPYKQSGKRSIPTRYTSVRDFLDTQDPAQIRTVILDSLTLLYASVAEYCRHKAGLQLEESMEGRNYEIVHRLFLRMIEVIQGWDVNLIALAHEKNYESETGPKQIVPALTGKMGELLPAYFQHILHTTVESKGDRTQYLWDIRYSRRTVASSPLAREGTDTLPQDFTAFFPSTEKENT